MFNEWMNDFNIWNKQSLNIVSFAVHKVFIVCGWSNAKKQHILRALDCDLSTEHNFSCYFMHFLKYIINMLIINLTKIIIDIIYNFRLLQGFINEKLLS